MKHYLRIMPRSTFAPPGDVTLRCVRPGCNKVFYIDRTTLALMFFEGKNIFTRKWAGEAHYERMKKWSVCRGS